MVPLVDGRKLHSQRPIKVTGTGPHPPFESDCLSITGGALMEDFVACLVDDGGDNRFELSCEKWMMQPRNSFCPPLCPRLQGEHSRCFQPPVDTKTNVTFL